MRYRFILRAVALVILAIIAVSSNGSGDRALAKPTFPDRTSAGSYAIWDALVFNSESSCWKDAREAVDSAYEDLDPFSDRTLYDVSYIEFVLDLPWVKQNTELDKRLSNADFKSAKKVWTASFEVKLEGGDEIVYVDIIESKLGERKTDKGTVILWHSLTTIHGDSLCGEEEDKPEGNTFFSKFTVWYDGYYQSTKGKEDESTSLDAAWAKALKKTFENKGDIDFIECCEIAEHKSEPTPEPSPKKKAPGGGAKPPPLDKDKKHSMVVPSPGNGSGTENGVYSAPIAGPESVMFGTIVDPTTGAAGPTDYVVGTVEPNGKKTFWRGLTDENGRFKFTLPAIALTSVLVFRFFDKDGNPDKAADTAISAPEVPNTEPVPNVPESRRLAIVRGASAYQRGGGAHGLFQLQTRGNDPLDTRIVIDGRADGAQVVAASNDSVSALLDDDLALGRHTIAIESGGKRSTAFPADVVEIAGEPVPMQQVGSVSTVRVHVIGLPPSDAATMAFQVGGAATLASGGSETVVPVHNGIAEVQIRGAHSGQALVRFHLQVSIQGFWPARQ